MYVRIAIAALAASLLAACDESDDPAGPASTWEANGVTLSLTPLSPTATAEAGTAAGGDRRLMVTGDFKASCQMGPPPTPSYTVQGSTITLTLADPSSQPCIEGHWPIRYTATIAPLLVNSYTVRVVHVNDAFRSRSPDTVLTRTGVFVHAPD